MHIKLISARFIETEKFWPTTLTKTETLVRIFQYQQILLRLMLSMKFYCCILIMINESMVNYVLLHVLMMFISKIFHAGWKQRLSWFTKPRSTSSRGLVIWCQSVGLYCKYSLRSSEGLFDYKCKRYQIHVYSKFFNDQILKYFTLFNNYREMI